jgi:hypothetical protein
MMMIKIEIEVRLGMTVFNSVQKATVSLLLKFAQERPLHYPVLLCLVTGLKIPLYCVPMPRYPVPPEGALFDEQFGRYYKEKVAETPALHDGAVILSRASIAESYAVSGWSYRLVSPQTPTDAEPNRGSAYNSALSMSVVEGVDLVALVLSSGVEVYVRGRGRTLNSDVSGRETS